jgi:U3 small nucleolar RNA-associated protein 16
MVTTRRGADTGSNIASSSPATLKAQKKRRAEPEDNEQESPSLTKRKKVDESDNTRSESPVISREIAVRPHPDIEQPETSTEEPIPALPVRNHIRFNSASPPPATATPAIVQAPEVVEDEAEESDDDAAPEEVSLSTSKAQSRAVEEQTEQIAKELSESAKRKRRRRDAQLKAQAAGSTKRKEKKEKTALEKVEEREDEGDEQSMEKSGKKKQKRKEKKEEIEKSLYSLDNIPDLLPDELLATEAPIRLPTPPTTSKLSLSKDMKTFEPFAPLKIPRENAPKDLTYNNLSVRVLVQKNPLLPPKVTSRSKSIRETWLKGRSAFAKTTSRRETGGKLQRRFVGSATKAFV